MYNIYIIQNKITSKVYVGQSISVKNRLREHRCGLNKNSHSNQYLQKAWNSYGSDAFEFYILDSLDTKEEMNKAEIFYIKWYKDLGLCYNLTFGGESNIPTKETRLKLSLSAKNRPPISEETREKLRNRVVSEETKRKISESNIGNCNHLNKPHSEETKIKMSTAHKGKIFSEETKLKMSKATKNRPPISEESRQKMSIAAKNRQQKKFSNYKS